MRKLLVLSLVVLAAAAAGCARKQCGEWRADSLFGFGRQNYQQYPQYQMGGACCDPCGGGGAASAEYGSFMQPTEVMTPGVMTQQAPCCQ
jgi:hypothetical protein